MSALPECAPSALTARSPTNSTPPPPSTVSLYCGQRPKHAPRHIEIANSLIAEPSRGDIDSAAALDGTDPRRSEEHTSELQSLMRTSYAVFCLKKKNYTHT